MGRIVLAISVDVVVQAVMAVLSSESNLVAEVMLIAALTMNDGSENALLGHVGNHHLIPAIDTVFQKHHWYMGPLIGIYDLPALLNGISASHFTAHIFSCFHKFNSQIQMVFPGGAKDDRIHCIHLQNLFIIQGGLGAGPPLFSISSAASWQRSS